MADPERLETIEVEPPEPQRNLIEVGAGAVDFGTPPLPQDEPPLWRAYDAERRRRAWLDLGAWVEWLVESYSLRDPGEWWRSRGAVEELLALRSWHRELVDVVVAPPDAEDPEEAASVAQDECERRRAHAQSWVHWHHELHMAMSRLGLDQPAGLLRRGGPRELADRRRAAAARRAGFRQLVS